MKKKLLISAIIAITVTSTVFAESASEFFARVSAYYGTVQDYEAHIKITTDDLVESGTISYKSPNKLHVKFESGKVININNKELIIFAPALGVSFSQELAPISEGTLSTLTSTQGLNMMRNSFGIGYESTPDYVSLGNGSSQKVVKLVLRGASDGYVRLDVSVGKNNLIRRIVAHTAGGAKIQYDFTKITINGGIPEKRFDYDTPSTGNTFVNFLFNPERK